MGEVWHSRGPRIFMITIPVMEFTVMIETIDLYRKFKTFTVTISARMYRKGQYLFLPNSLKHYSISTVSCPHTNPKWKTIHFSETS